MALKINLPPITRALLAVIVGLTLLYNIARWRLLQLDSDPGATNPNDPSLPAAPPRTPVVPYIALVPSQCLWYPWTLLTATFAEQNIFTLLVNGATVFFGGKYLERAWGSRGFVHVILIASIIPNLLVVPTYLFWAAVMGNPETALTPITGGITTQAAFLVAFKQLVPEHTVSIYRGMIKMRVKHFPAVFLAANTLSGFFLGTDTALLLAWYGLVTTWTYLRFYKHQPDLSSTSSDSVGLKGDASETFAFATFFPDVMQPPIAAVCDQIFALLCQAKICTPFSDEDVATGNEQAAARGEAGLPTFTSRARAARGMSKREEAERRRALALKALDERLNAASSRAGTQSAAASSVPDLPKGQEMLGQTDYRPDV
jgi:membrane associated rhomboid family serine protease